MKFNYDISLPEKKKKLMKLNTFPKNNPFKNFDDSLKTPKTLFTPIQEIRPNNLLEKIVNMTNKEKEQKEKDESAIWLKKNKFTERPKIENRTNKVSDMIEPVNYERIFEESFVDVDEHLENLKWSDFKPGKEEYLLFDVNETNFEIKTMTKNVMGFPSKVTLKNEKGETEYNCYANNIQDYYLIEETDDCVFYYPMKKSLKLKKVNKKEENLNQE
ncbi:hypothetical protein M153_4710001368 [Pseudoloma neurophilia]|uniref:Uncharacterized protein n=1 Tax=Pseudoloma neurophilia TaxID=146866 RepID=A0A0R0M4Y4_9MICR|nr:hypothetical protein M153_4710001368 [Pseudoloma neurophilia]